MRTSKIRFGRMEWAGSLGDLGTLLPLAIGMIVICGLRATNVLVMVGGLGVVLLVKGLKHDI